MASPALPYAAALFLLLAPLLASAESPISLPPASSPTASPADSTPADAALAPSQPPSEASSAATLSPPAPPQTSPLPAPSQSPVPHSAATAPAPSAAKDKDDDEEEDDKEKDKEERSSTPAPAPAAEEIKATAAGDKAAEEDGETERHGDELNGGKKAGVVVGAFSAAAVVGLAAVVWKKRQANIRRSRYADYSARLELV
uniref:Uncharacterized protein n=1 Tax=Oryza punctata TaxID=4537 RepID=A0A0E0KLM9_ORYPU